MIAVKQPGETVRFGGVETLVERTLRDDVHGQPREFVTDRHDGRTIRLQPAIRVGFGEPLRVGGDRPFGHPRQRMDE